MARYQQDPSKIIDWMIRQGRRSDEIAAEFGIQEHHIMARMEEIAGASELS